MSKAEEKMQERAEKFQTELQVLLGKHKLALGAVAFLQLDGRIAARLQIADESTVKQDPKVEKPTEKSELSEE